MIYDCFKIIKDLFKLLIFIFNLFLPVAHGDKGLREATFKILLLLVFARTDTPRTYNCSPSSSDSQLNISYYVVYLSD